MDYFKYSNESEIQVKLQSKMHQKINVQLHITVKPVNKGRPKKIQHMVFIDKCPLYRGYIVLLNQERVNSTWSL